MVISCLYVQTVTRQCFCFPNSQWGATTHDIPPQREDRKLDILENIKFLSAKQKHAMEKHSQYFVFTQSVHAVQQNQSELDPKLMECLRVALD